MCARLCIHELVRGNLSDRRERESTHTVVDGHCMRHERTAFQNGAETLDRNTLIDRWLIFNLLSTSISILLQFILILKKL